MGPGIRKICCILYIIRIYCDSVEQRDGASKTGVLCTNLYKITSKEEIKH
jgi:hypothetical protein